MAQSPAEPAAVILPARHADMEAVFRIAEASFPIPWPLIEFEKELIRPYSALRVLRPSRTGPVAGFLNYWLIIDELQIMNLAVAPEYRCRGYGCALLDDLNCLAGPLGVSMMTLEVRRSNAQAIRLYERYGFSRVGVRPQYYSDNAEDALVMRRALSRP